MNSEKPKKSVYHKNLKMQSGLPKGDIVKPIFENSNGELIKTSKKPMTRHPIESPESDKALPLADQIFNEMIATRQFAPEQGMIPFFRYLCLRIAILENKIESIGSQMLHKDLKPSLCVKRKSRKAAK